MADEELLTVVESLEAEFEAAGLDVSAINETETYLDEDNQVRERPTAEAARVVDLLDAMAQGRASHPDPDRMPKSRRGARFARHEVTNFGDGKTIREAIKVQQRAELRARMRAGD